MRKVLIMGALLSVWLVSVASTPVVTGAKVRINAKKYKEAIEVLEQNKAKYPDDPELFFYLAQAYVGVAQWVKAGENFTLALEKNPKKKLKKKIEKLRERSWASFVKDGLTLFQHERWPEAIAKYRMAIKIDPSEKRSYSDLGATFLNLARALESADSPNTDSIKICYEDAIESYKKAIELDPEDDKVIKSLGQTYMRAEKTDEAVELYEDFLDNNPEDLEVQRQLFGIYMSRSENDRALEIYEQWDEMGLEVGEDISMADIYNAGSCYYRLFIDLEKKEDDASKEQAAESLKNSGECFAQVFEDDPTDCESGMQLYYIYIAQQDWENVVQAIETMLENDCTRDYATLTNLAVGYTKLGQSKKAAGIFKEAQEIKKESGDSN
ncbi:MAG: DUF2225 domain-containing protein [Gemmatimonadota bacterium]|nr:DUF2225 domain-containing protein [Gemmatimonadota bacterium]